MGMVTRFDDLNGDLTCWGACREPARGLLPRRGTAAAREREDLPFGDLRGTLAYWGPAGGAGRGESQRAA